MREVHPPLCFRESFRDLRLAELVEDVVGPLVRRGVRHAGLLQEVPAELYSPQKHVTDTVVAPGALGSELSPLKSKSMHRCSRR